MSSREAFLGALVDYAGLFPPAQLALEPALRNYARYQTSSEAWMLGRFVCPAARLNEILQLDQAIFPESRPVVFSALGRGGKDTKEFFANVQLDLADIARFRAVLGARVEVDAYEVRLPPSAFNAVKANQLASLVATTAYLIETAGPPALAPFFESPATDRDSLLAIIQKLHDDRHSTEARGRQRAGAPGFKLRTGGLEEAAFPSVETVALALAACRAAHVPFKATAGLHHPFRHFSKEVGASMHGFVNVFAAGCLGLAHSLDEKVLQKIVEDERPEHFTLGPDALQWHDLRVSADTIAQARLLFTSFGSCSFDEPREDLRGYHWLG